MNTTGVDLDKLAEENVASIRNLSLEHRNELVIDDFYVYRFLGHTEQYEEDWYWVLHGRSRNHYIMDIILLSCVGGVTFLKGCISEEAYNQMDRTWNFNKGSVEDGLELTKKRGIVIV